MTAERGEEELGLNMRPTSSIKGEVADDSWRIDMIAGRERIHQSGAKPKQIRGVFLSA